MTHETPGTSEAELDALQRSAENGWGLFVHPTAYVEEIRRLRALVEDLRPDARRWRYYRSGSLMDAKVDAKIAALPASEREALDDLRALEAKERG